MPSKYSPESSPTLFSEEPGYCPDPEYSWRPTSPEYSVFSPEELAEEKKKKEKEDKEEKEDEDEEEDDEEEEDYEEEEVDEEDEDEEQLTEEQVKMMKREVKMIEEEESKMIERETVTRQMKEHDHNTRYLLSKTKIDPKWEAMLRWKDLPFVYKWIGENFEHDSNALINFMLRHPDCTSSAKGGKDLNAEEKMMWADIYHFKQTYDQEVFDKTEICTLWEQKLELNDAVFARYLHAHDRRAAKWFCTMAMKNPGFIYRPLSKWLEDLDKESQANWDTVRLYFDTYSTYINGSREDEKHREACRITTDTPRPKFSPFGRQGNGPEPSCETYMQEIEDGDEHAWRFDTKVVYDDGSRKRKRSTEVAVEAE